MAKKQIRDYVFTPGIAGAGSIKVLDKIQLNQILLITNTTDNRVLYNFADSTNQIIVEFSDAFDASFPYANSVSNGVTTIHFQFDTSDQSSTDSISIFIEDEETRFRPYDFGTDAIERMRVATPQSMIDADFEYGIQPTKWMTIDQLRGYPSTYEIPGSDINVTAVVTDASFPYGGVGASLITVTTQENHGFTSGQPFRIVGLLESVRGSSRAEGSFIVDIVLSPTSFQYFAKGRVGENQGDSLYATYTQLRSGGFYTGASIGSPTFSLDSNGSSGNFVTRYNTRIGSSRLPYSGANNAIVGSPLSAGNLIAGTQVTGLTTTTASTTFAQSVVPPTNIIQVADSTGIQVGSSLDDGTGTATFVTNIDGNTLTLSDPYTVVAVGSSNAIGIVTASLSGFGTGSGALFQVGRIDGRYSPSVTTAGAGYTTGDRVIALGSSMGGNPANNLIIRVRDVDASGGITTFTTNKYFAPVAGAVLSQSQAKFGTASLLLNPAVAIAPATAQSILCAANEDFNFGTGDFTVEFFIYRNRTGVSEVLFDMRNTASDSVPNIIVEAGGTIALRIGSSNVISSSNTLGAGSWNHIAISRTDGTTRLYLNGQAEGGTYADANNYPARAARLGADLFNQNGTYAYFDETRITSGYSRYSTNTVTVPGNRFDTDIYTVSLLHFNGYNGKDEFADESYGTAISSSETYSNVTGVTTSPGFGAVFDVLRIGGTSPTYTVSFISGATDTGTGYSALDTILIDGSVLGGASSTNDLTITVDAVDGSGKITAFTGTGTAADGNDSYSDVPVNNSGSGASFNVSKSGGGYVATIELPGSGYYPEYSLLIPGTSLGGTSPTNDLSLTIDSINLNSSPIGGISAVTPSGTPPTGTSIDFFPSVAISEPTTGLIFDSTTVSFSSLARIRVSFANNHGLVPGSTIISSITSSGVGHSLATGPFIVDNIPAPNQLVYSAKTSGSITAAGLAGTIYPRPDCFYVHRPFDGGVQLGAGGPAHGAHAVRQSKKYIRYQSGKGIMYTTGCLFAPSYDLRTVTAAGISTGSLITCTTDDTEHGLQVGAEIQLSNITSAGYDDHYTVNSIINENTFTVLSNGVLSTANPELGRPPTVSLYRWKGATVRAGAFDDQNGIFWQYDGINLAVGYRSSTFQLAGTISASPDSNLITGTNTRFVDQLVIGDRIVIRGMTHIVTSIFNNTSITVSPDFRGTAVITGARAALTQDFVIPQYQWNLDRADGTGASGYEIQINRMQMIGFQYSWYGAGFIDWMLRGPNGNYLFVHRLKHNNRNTEAYMRSGNLPVRYEVINEGPRSKLSSQMTSSQNTIPLEDATLYPTTGTLYLDNELVNYTGKSGNTLTGVSRAATFVNFSGGSQRTYSAGAAASHSRGTGAILISNTATPVISHWGSAFLTDGLFDSDRGYIFNYQYVGGTLTTVKSTLFMIRLAPSVSNAITGDLGSRELINRAQLLLKGLEFTPTSGATSQAVIIEGVLNPSNYPTDVSSVNWFNLTSQGAGGQPSFAQLSNASNIIWSGGAETITASTTVNQNYFTQYQIFDKVATANVRVGYFVSGSGVPGGTRVVNIFRYNNNNNYIQFSNSVNSGPSGTSYTFTANTVSAAPGETVFSFVTNATQPSALDLSELKELNNTPIGGRGTFPNGPDVLAINAYVTTGSVGANFVLRWSEAQA